MEVAGYLASVLIGVSLGLIGGGGSILTVPVLVYLFGIDAVPATGYSLFIVGLTSAIGSGTYFFKNLVNVRTAVVFGLPSIAAVFATRAWLVPAIPDVVFSIGDFEVTKRILLMVLFAVLMIAASVSMIRKSPAGSGPKPESDRPFRYGLVMLEGTVVGILTGMVGAGGGFLIIPALVVLGKLPMKEAVGTSLVIIAAKSLIGFIGEIGHQPIDWFFLLQVSVFAVVGIFIGATLSRRISGDQLKPAFGWFVLVVGVYIILKELFWT
ncbi:MAG: sulfite exporter TauE/SafE family protein [Chitinophagales bacterium]|nr:sulfite exporter TauE/SafE family protein [Chitinophagales bacterium]MDW8393819.1 sulfite exporter TauE/SafE family protein [Chitinophagales bacterium]